MNNPTNLVIDLTDKKKLMVSVGLPSKFYCYTCARADIGEGRQDKNYPARMIDCVLYKNFRYKLRHPEKETYEERIVPIISNSWDFIFGGYIVFCETCINRRGDLERPHSYFWEFSGTGYDYFTYYEKYISKSLVKIYNKVHEHVKNLPDEAGIEVERDWVESSN